MHNSCIDYNKNNNTNSNSNKTVWYHWSVYVALNMGPKFTNWIFGLFCVCTIELSVSLSQKTEAHRHTFLYMQKWRDRSNEMKKGKKNKAREEAKANSIYSLYIAHGYERTPVCFQIICQKHAKTNYSSFCLLNFRGRKTFVFCLKTHTFTYSVQCTQIV